MANDATVLEILRTLLGEAMKKEDHPRPKKRQKRVSRPSSRMAS
jgi:hypothetical protein